jgi:pimeloyl-ACP methyl ester carboxylesterase
MKVSSFIPRSSQPPLWREARLGLEAAGLLRDPVLRGEGLRDGRGRPALLIPGFLAGDASLALMSDWMRRAGYRPCPTGIRVNADCGGAAVARLEQRLERAVSEQGQRAVVIGQSRGGSFAKVLAVRRPDLVCGLVTLGSPHKEPLAVHPVVRLHVEAVSRLGSLGAPGLFKRSCLEDDCCATFWEELAAPMPAGTGFVSIYSRSDGIVDWRACLDPAADELIEISSSHIGMAVSPAAWRGVAKALERFRRAEARRPAARQRPARKLRSVA